MKKKVGDIHDKKYCKVRDICHYECKHRVAAHNICRSTCKTPKKISVVSHNWSSYENHF